MIARSDLEAKSTLTDCYQTKVPVSEKFLTFLAADIESNPQRLLAMNPTLQGRLRQLVGGIDVDLDQLLQDYDE